MSGQSRLGERLARGETVVIDGGTGTEIERRGGDSISGLWSGAMALEHGDIIGQVHRSYLEAGADMIITNTYASSKHLLERAGFADQFELLNRRGVELALQARDETQRPDAVVAGSMSTTEMRGARPPIEVARANYEEQAAILADAGAELIILEMMRDIDHMVACLDGALASGLPVWLGFSCPPGHPELMYDHQRPLADGVRAIADRPIEVVSVMHSEVDDIDLALNIIFEHWDGPVGAYAHVGSFPDFKWIPDPDFTPEMHTSHNQRWIERGVQVVGGCCGIGPDHIADLRSTLRA